MKGLRFLFVLLIAVGSIGISALAEEISLVPMPNSIEVKDKGSLQLGRIRRFVVNAPEGLPARELLCSVFKHRLGVDITKPGKQGVEVVMQIDSTLYGNEHYRINTTQRLLEIAGSTPEALYRAVTTLDQILMADVKHTLSKEIALLKIEDKPRLSRRALMLDPARNFLPVEDVKRYIDEMWRYKFNVLQLHLTDDEGWRFEVKSHPELTAGAQFYTQEQLQDIIDYAAKRYIEVVPELDVPGHTRALLTVHPEFGCCITDSVALRKVHGNNVMVCASQPEVYKLYEDVLGEVARVFKSPYIHLGGDEAAVERNWAFCDKDRELMKQYGYSKPSDIMNYFFDRMLNVVRGLGRTAILWCENDNIRMPAREYLFPYPKDVVLVTWRYGLTPLCQRLTRESGHKLIMAPGETAYFDYPQYKNDLPEHNNWGMPTTTLQRSYTLDPGDGDNIAGVMGTLWGEAIKDINRAFYMTYPRALALAEAGWTQMPQRSWESFKLRLPPLLTDMMKRGVPYRVPFEIYR